MAESSLRKVSKNVEINENEGLLVETDQKLEDICIIIDVFRSLMCEATIHQKEEQLDRQLSRYYYNNNVVIKSLTTTVNLTKYIK